MDFVDYQKKALRTAKDRATGLEEESSKALAFCYAGLGVSGEAGELAGVVKKYLFQGRNFLDSRILAKDEIGDVLWYLSWVADLFGLTLGECAVANIEKLEKRYPKQFTPDGGIRSE